MDTFLKRYCWTLDALDNVPFFRFRMLLEELPKAIEREAIEELRNGAFIGWQVLEIARSSFGGPKAKGVTFKQYFDGFGFGKQTGNNSPKKLTVEEALETAKIIREAARKEDKNVQSIRAYWRDRT